MKIVNTHEHKSVQLNTNANNWIQVNRNMDADGYKWIQIDTHGKRITNEYNWLHMTQWIHMKTNG